MRIRALLTVGLLVPLILAACGERSTPTAADGSDEQIAIQNQRNQQQLEALIAEVDPYVRYAADGSWSLAPEAKLSPAAAEFARQAHAMSQNVLTANAQLTQPGGPRLATAPNQSGIRFYWWGARVAVPSGVAGAIRHAWRTSGGAAAVRVFLTYYGWSGWAVSAAGALVPAYAATIWYVDRVGGYRGVFMYVPWSIVPTYIAPQ